MQQAGGSYRTHMHPWRVCEQPTCSKRTQETKRICDSCPALCIRRRDSPSQPSRVWNNLLTFTSRTAWYTFQSALDCQIGPRHSPGKWIRSAGRISWKPLFVSCAWGLEMHAVEPHSGLRNLSSLWVKWVWNTVVCSPIMLQRTNWLGLGKRQDIGSEASGGEFGLVRG